jgi:Na+/H+-dicarboxylate symporter
MPKLALHWQILIGILLGIGAGLLFIETGLTGIAEDWIGPFGTIFIRLLKLIAVPLVLVSLINGVTNMKDITRLSKIGSKTIGFYILSTIVAITIGLTVVNIVQPGSSFSEAKQEQFQDRYSEESAQQQLEAGKVQDRSPLDFLVNLVPENIFSAIGDNGEMLKVIFFALIFGIAMVMLPDDKTVTIKHLINGLNDVVLKIVDIIMRFAPFGVFGLFVKQIVQNSDTLASLFEALSIYALTVVLGLLIMVFAIYPLVLRIFTKLRYGQFFKGILPAQLTAISTSSSAATLPITMDRCEKSLGVSENISSFVLPLGATINMDGTSLYQSVAAVFIAQAFGFDLTFSQQITIVLTATLASIGSAAVPGAGIIMLVIVLESIGLDPSGIGLVLAVDRPLDMLRTSVNITGDSTIASLIASSEGELNPPIQRL